MNCPNCNALMGIVGPEEILYFHCPTCGHFVPIEREEREMRKKVEVEVIEMVYRDPDDKIHPISVDLLSWESREPRLNIRRMFKSTRTKKFVFAKGVTLSDPEVLAVHKALGKYIEKHKIS